MLSKIKLKQARVLTQQRVISRIRGNTYWPFIMLSCNFRATEKLIKLMKSKL